jgi:hypothetical protein
MGMKRALLTGARGVQVHGRVGELQEERFTMFEEDVAEVPRTFVREGERWTRVRGRGKGVCVCGCGGGGAVGSRKSFGCSCHPRPLAGLRAARRAPLSARGPRQDGANNWQEVLSFHCSQTLESNVWLGTRGVSCSSDLDRPASEPPDMDESAAPRARRGPRGRPVSRGGAAQRGLGLRPELGI